jgi:hypothetical protein
VIAIDRYILLYIAHHNALCWLILIGEERPVASASKHPNRKRPIMANPKGCGYYRYHVWVLIGLDISNSSLQIELELYGIEDGRFERGWKSVWRETGENPWSFEALVNSCIRYPGDKPGAGLFSTSSAPQKINSRNGAPDTGLSSPYGQ